MVIGLFRITVVHIVLVPIGELVVCDEELVDELKPPDRGRPLREILEVADAQGDEV